ncbi:hypothetical protein F4553_007785 [Allocatelliglobosispora scoriae]|uniref:Uncharacterized protein n=1 Tax=Allocatelliglobosispora scoriae TaxID=643052 RepID=A0A841C6D6_9ACTN|nr:hypothetical protein [Allocatelliglobosispora scoriae]MBB5874351.1 hypothetical protein [Allocatelliglobosispora scoriae]
MEMTTFRIAVTGGLMALAVLLAWWWAHGPMSRARLAGFSRQHGLPITTGNGDRVIAYLAITRRWRCAGAATGAVTSAALRLFTGEPGIDVISVFAGWFAGALVAELLLAPTPTGVRRSASLAVRRAGDYVHPVVWALPLVAAAGWAVATAWTLFAGRPSAWALAALAVLVPVLLVRHRVLLRPQPAGPADVTDAETAIRSRSLRVLCSAGFALASYCALVALPTDDSVAVTVAALLVLVVARFAGAVVPSRYRIRPA